MHAQLLLLKSFSFVFFWEIASVSVHGCMRSHAYVGLRLYMRACLHNHALITACVWTSACGPVCARGFVKCCDTGKHTCACTRAWGLQSALFVLRKLFSRDKPSGRNGCNACCKTYNYWYLYL